MNHKASAKMFNGNGLKVLKFFYRSMREETFSELKSHLLLMGKTIRHHDYFNTDVHKKDKFKEFYNSYVIKESREEYINYYEEEGLRMSNLSQDSRLSLS
mmetsp:Transcript_31693/g.30981  ORF Transcript_31693/g.30981 Transcript_31693/m.30981 type:complete len:100 (-) Transcript_31693:27-326(-)